MDDDEEARKIVEWHLLAAHVLEVRPLLHQAITESGQPDDTAGHG